MSSPATEKSAYLLSAVIFAVIFFHCVNLDGLPLGLYLDETSIGINAASIAATGADEHGIKFPTYFKAFGEYKNPIFIYVCAGLFKLFGVSAEGLRATSCLFFMLGFVPTLLLFCRLAPGSKSILIFSSLSFGFSPILFALSRISFEVISQYAFTAWALYLTWILATDPLTNVKRYCFSLLLGLIVGLSVYSYSTARLLSALYCLGLAYLFFNRRDFPILVFIAIGCLVTLIPYAQFAIENQSALTNRFKDISYVDDKISVGEKLGYFFGNYVEYFSLKFLLYKGDGNLRHAIGFGGEIFVTIYALALASLFGRKELSYDAKKFYDFLLINLLFSPVAAALTNEGTPHALRGMLTPIYLTFVSCFGFYYVSVKFSARLAKLKKYLLFFLGFESALYVLAYFIAYPERSIEATEGYGTEQRLQEAIYRAPVKVYFVNDPGASYADAKFYLALVENPANIPVEIIGDREVNPQKNECVVYHRWNKMEERLGAPVYENAPIYRANWLQRKFGIQDKPHVMKLRCY